jgi:hypothetical protein
MNTFMGPMTPPPASPGQPQKLDIRTNPNQRAGFKQFMRQRTAPMMPIQQMPQAQPMPMMQPRPQMPLRMEMGGDVDIFDPQNYHEGGLVNTLGQLGTMSGQMVDALNTIVMGGGQGGGATSGFDSGSGFASTPSVSPTTPNVPPVSPATPDFVNPNVLSSSGGQTDPQAILNSQMSGGQGSIFTEGQPTPSVFPSGPSGNAPADDPRTPQNEYQDFLDSGVSDTGNPFFTSGPFGEINPDDFKVVEPLRETFGMKDGGAVPPRNTNIGGQPHMLSYITPDEADILEALGGSGEAGPMGIPAFKGDPGQMADRDKGGRSGPGDMGGGSDDDDRGYGGSDADEVGDATAEADAMTRAESDADDRIAERERQTRQAQAIQQRRDEINRMQDRVQSGLAREDLVTSPGVTTPETTISVTRSPGLSQSDIAAVGGVTDTDDKSDADEEGDASLLGDIFDDILSLDPRDEGKFSTVAGQTAVGPVTGPLSGTTTSGVQPTTVTVAGKTYSTKTTSGTGSDDEDEDQDVQQDIAVRDFLEGKENRNYIEDDILNKLQKANLEQYTGLTPKGLDPKTGLSNYAKEGSPFQAGDPDALFSTRPGTVTRHPKTGVLTSYEQTRPAIEYDPVTDQYTGYRQDVDLPGSLGFLTELFGIQPNVYTGFGAASQPDPDFGSGGPDPVKPPFDPCPDGFVLKDGVCTPIQQADTGDGTPNQIGGGPDQPPPVPGGPVVVPSTRPTGPFNLQGPVGYGSPIAGQANPSVATNAALYQQMLNQQAAAPIRLQSGGPVSSNLDRAADNFLKSLMPTA